ncbi:MAG: hypothetical protein R3B45_08090 [Bdellovibrionota bacterium]
MPYDKKIVEEEPYQKLQNSSSITNILSSFKKLHNDTIYLVETKNIIIYDIHIKESKIYHTALRLKNIRHCTKSTISSFFRQALSDRFSPLNSLDIFLTS